MVLSKDHIFAIGDVHGCDTELRLLLNRLPLDANSTIIFLGDLIDRGPNSKGVVDTVIELSQSLKVLCLRGNHEEMMLAFLDKPQSEKAGMFIYNGGGATLASYGHDDGTYTIPPDHIKFYRAMKIYHETEKYFFVHAGVPEISLDDINISKHTEEMLWIREPFLSSDFEWSKMIVHGHTPVRQVEMKRHRINLDTGCVYDCKLTAMSFPSKEIYSVVRQERLQHVYLKDVKSSRRGVRFHGSVPLQIIRDGQYFPFETINYNEFGVYIRDLSGGSNPEFSMDEIVSGEIGSQMYDTASFEGQIVRVDQKDDGIFYAISMSDPIQVENE